MPTIFERLDTTLQGNDLSVHLTVQTGNLGAVANFVAGLINNPPNSVGDLGAAINELPLPDFGVDPSFVTSLDKIRTAVPSDFSSVTGALTSALQGVSETIGSDITDLLDTLLRAIRAIDQLTKIDFTCDDADTSGTIPAGLLITRRGTTNRSGVASSADDPADPSPLVEITTVLNDAQALLDSAPTNLEETLTWLDDTLQIFSQEQGFTLPLPIVHEWIDPLQTLQIWRNMQPDEIRDHIGQTLQALSAFIQSTVAAKVSTVTTELAATTANLHTTELATIAADVTTGLAQLKTAVNQGDLSSTTALATQLNTRLDEYATLRTTMQASLLAGLPALNDRLSALPDDLTEQMCHLQSVLSPNATLSILQHLPPELLNVESPAATAIEEQLQPLVDWLQQLADKLDISALQAPLQSVADSVQSTVDGLDQELANITVQVRALFAQVEALTDEVDIQALVDKLQEAIDNFASELTNQLAVLFEPVRQAVAQVIESIDEGVNSFNPASIVATLQDAIQKVADVLNAPDVVSALDSIQRTVEASAGQLEELSFAPLTDQVIEQIKKVTESLQAIDPDSLSVPLRAALTAAVAVLPADLKPITNPFVDDFGVIVTTGPVPLLTTVQAQPQRLLENVRRFEPGILVGDALSQPFQQLIRQMEAFQPSSLLAPVEQELDKLKERLRQSANPAAPLALLEGPFNTLLQAFDQLSPDGLVKPLEDAISAVLDGLIDVLPTDEIFAQVDNALGTVNDVVTLIQSLTNIVQKVHELLAGFANAGGQVDSWLDAILDKVEAIGDTNVLQPRFSALVAALDEIKAPPLTSTFEGATAPLLTALSDLNPQAKLAALVQAFSTFPNVALAALSDSAEKTALTALLARITPLDPAFSAPYRELTAFQKKLAQTQSHLQGTLSSWDIRYHGEDGLLQSFRQSGATAAELRQWVQDALEPQFIEPTRLLLRFIEPAAAPLAAFAGVFAELALILQNKLDELLLGPTSLGGIRDNLQALVQRLRDFNLGFLRDSIHEVFAAVRSKVEAIGPAHLKQGIETAFGNMLNTITINQVLPPDLMATLNADYTAVINKLKALDPGTLVIQVVQPEFESKIIPLLAAFDLTILFTALLERLSSLEEELRAELERVNVAYQEMLGAVPSLSLSLDLDVEIDIGF